MYLVVCYLDFIFPFWRLFLVDFCIISDTTSTKLNWPKTDKFLSTFRSYLTHFDDIDDKLWQLLTNWSFVSLLIFIFFIIFTNCLICLFTLQKVPLFLFEVHWKSLSEFISHLAEPLFAFPGNRQGSSLRHVRNQSKTTLFLITICNWTRPYSSVRGVNFRRIIAFFYEPSHRINFTDDFILVFINLAAVHFKGRNHRRRFSAYLSPRAYKSNNMRGAARDASCGRSIFF